jgi:hypothetical protein
VSPLVAIALALAAATLVPSPAAQTFVVSAAGGPGVAFTDMPQAVAGVPDGATLLVRPGNYSNFTIDAKGLTVLADLGVTVQLWPIGIVTVQNLAVHQTVVLHGLELSGSLAPSSLQCQGCLGTVLVQRCRLAPNPGGSGGSLRVTQCREVRVADSEFLPIGGPALAIGASAVFVARTRGATAGGSGAAIVATGSALELTDCDLRSWGIGSFAAPVYIDAGCVARLSGTTMLQALAPAVAWTPAIAGYGTVVLDPGVLLVANVPAIEPGVTTVVRAMPAVAAPAAPLGAIATASLSLPAGAIGGLWFGRPVPAFVAPPFAVPLALDPASAVPIAAGAVSPVAVGYTVPALAALRGARFVFQGWSHDPAGGFQASNAVTVVPW